MTPPSPNQPADNASRPRAWLRRVAWCEPFWIAALGVLCVIPPRFLPSSIQPYLSLLRPIVVLAVVLGLLVRKLAYQKVTRRTPIDWPLLIMLLWLPVSFWASADTILSWEALSFLLVGVALYLALLNWPPAERRPQIIAAIIVLLGSGVALIAPWVSNLSADKLFRLPFVDQTLQQAAAQVPGEVNPNRIAGILVLTLPLAFALLIQRGAVQRRWQRGLYGAAAALTGIALVLTQSRGAYMAVAVALGTICVVRWPRLRSALPIVLIAGIAVTVRIGWQPMLEMVLSDSALNSVDGRLEIWSRAFYAISDFPFTGIGIGTFDRVIPLLYPLFSIAPDVQLTHAHNLLLQVALDTGLPGLIAYLALFINTFAMIFKALRQRTAALDWTLAAGVLGGLVAMFVHGVFDAPLWGSKPAFLPWLMVALAMQVALRVTADSLQPVDLPDARTA